MIEQKIIEVFKSSGMSRTEFADKLQISNAILSHLASGRNKASLDLVVTILTYFPEISADWLILNKGEMIRADAGNSKLMDAIGKIITGISETNQLMARQMETLKKSMEDLK